MKRSSCALLLAGLFALPIGLHAKPVARSPNLTSAEVQKQIIGHSMKIGGDEEDAVTWYFKPGGKYAAEDRNYHEGRYAVRPDGKLCWTENNGIAGCFQYYRAGKGLKVRRADPGHNFDLGPITIGPLVN